MAKTEENAELKVKADSFWNPDKQTFSVWILKAVCFDGEFSTVLCVSCSVAEVFPIQCLQSTLWQSSVKHWLSYSSAHYV